MTTQLEHLDLDDPALDEQRAREDLATLYQLALRHGFDEGIDTHHSHAFGEHRFLMHRVGLHFSEVMPENLEVHDHRVPEPTSDAYIIHSSIHRARPDARVVLHCHPPWSVALAMTGAELLLASQTATRFFERVAYDDGYVDVVNHPGVEEELAERIGDKDVLVLRNHGMVVVGQDAAQAWDRMFFFERACQHQVMSAALGPPLLIRPDVARGFQRRVEEFEGYDRMLWDAHRRLLAREMGQRPAAPGR